jgi:GNAT superfamily N-acetyltransferase
METKSDSDLRFGPPRPDEAAALGPLTWKAYRSVLERAGAMESGCLPLCHAAWRAGRPVGLAVAVAAPQDGIAELLSIMVAPGERRRGIGQALLRGLSETARQHGCREMHASWSDRLPGTDAFTGLIAGQHWTSPVAERLRMCGAVKHTLALFRDRHSLIARMEKGGLRFRSWAEAGAAAEAVAAEEIATGGVPEWADPARWRDSLCADMSLVLMDSQDTVQGWAVCERQPALNRWYFPIGWVLPPYDKRGWLLGAYAEGARRLAAAHGEDSMVVTEASPRLPGMWALLENHFRLHTYWVDRYLNSRTDLVAENARSPV